MLAASTGEQNKQNSSDKFTGLAPGRVKPESARQFRDLREYTPVRKDIQQ